MEKTIFTIVMPIMLRNTKQVEIAKDCYQSVINHSHDYEYIIIDNGSTEDTSYFKPDVFVRNKENKGISGAWNVGLKLAKTDYIVIINDDIIVHTGWLDKMKDALNLPNAGASNVHVEHLPHGIGVEERYKWFSGSCFMLKRSTVNRVGYFDEQFWPCNWEDVDYWTRLLSKGLKMYVDNSMTVQHKEGQTVHDKDLSSHFNTNRQRYIDKHGFNPVPYFYQDKNIYDVLCK